MSWFKVDDQLATHPKVLTAGNRAMGLWVRAASWAAAYETDGVVPMRMVGPLGGTIRDARALVDAGLWTEDGEAYRFHDWRDYQPSPDARNNRREADRERQRKAREQKQDGGGTSDADAGSA